MLAGLVHNSETPQSATHCYSLIEMLTGVVVLLLCAPATSAGRYLPSWVRLGSHHSLARQLLKLHGAAVVTLRVAV